jgi:hypothetical protein
MSIFKVQLQQGFATGEMGFNDKFERSLSALGFGFSLIPGARWLCRRRMLRCSGLARFTDVGSTRDSDRAVRVVAVKVCLLLFGVGRTVNLSAVLRDEL